MDRVLAYDIPVPQSVGAGDTFTGTFVAAHSILDLPVLEAIQLGQVAAARHVAGLSPLGGIVELNSFRRRRVCFRGGSA